MDKLGNQLKLRLQKHISASIDHLSPQKCSFKQKTKTVDYHLEWIAISEQPVILLPVLIASHSTDSKPKRSASSADILSDRPEVKSKMPASTFVDSTHMHPDPFKATFLWEKIVCHLERTVKTGRHVIGLRSYDNCFHGSKAVDSLVSYLNTILPKTVKRAQVVVLCEKLLETGVIESVKEKQEFREKGLFRFTFSHFWEPSPESSPLGSCDSDEMVSSLKDIPNGLPKSRSMEMIHPQSSSEKTLPASGPADLRLPILKGYASDSTVTLSTHRRKKRSKKTQKAVDKFNSRVKLNEFGTLTKHKLHTVTKHFSTKEPTFKVPTQPVCSKPVTRPAKLKPDVPTRSKSHKCTSSRPKESEKPKRRYSHREFVQVREKENGHFRESVNAVAAGLHKQQCKKTKQSSRLKERDSSLQNSRNWQHLSELSVNVAHGTTAILNSTGMNRSHSFSSCGELLQSAQVSDCTVRHSGKWIVYGFI